MLKRSYLGILCLSALTLSGCGGGGGGGSSANTAEGLWQGTSSSGANVTVAVLENGEAWGGATIGNSLVSALAGTASGNGTSFSASGSEFYFTSNTVSSGTYAGTVSQRQRIQATSPSTGSSIDLAYNAYYDQSITAAEIAGSYTLSGRTARYAISNLTFNIAANGAFTIVDNGCTTTGSATPRSAGKSIINVTAIGTGTCVLGNGVSLSGIALLDKATTPNTLYVIALNSAKSDGLVLIGQKN